MNYEIIAYGVFVLSLLGLVIFVYRKLPILAQIQEPLKQQNKDESPSALGKIAEKINPFKNFSHDIFLQKIISSVRVLSLKTDRKTFHWLQKLRQNSQRNKLKENDKYWDEIKKSTK